jgi:DNA-binding CsgD family transcriptional regulator
MSSKDTRLRIDPPDGLNEFVEHPTETDPISNSEVCRQSFDDERCQDDPRERYPLLFPIASAPTQVDVDFDESLDNSIELSSKNDFVENRLSRTRLNHNQPRELLQIVGAEYRRISQRFDADVKVLEFCQRLQGLSSRELDVLLLSIHGKSCKELAAHLDVGIATAAKHRASAFKKLNVRNSTELLFLLKTIFSQGYVPPYDGSDDLQRSRFVDRAIERIG